MSKEVQAHHEIDDFNKSLIEIEQTQKMVSALMRTPHYSKIGEVGVFTIVQKSRSIGLNPLDALNGGMYFVSGKVELSANTMNYMIRVKGHSITKDAKSNNQICILHGKRIDNGDTWTASFSIEEAKRAGIYKNTWEKYPEDMLFARAITRLGRQLFPDVLKGCYVEGEIKDAIDAQWVDKRQEQAKADAPLMIEDVTEKKTVISKEQYDILDDLIGEDVEYRNNILKHLANMRIQALDKLPVDLYERAVNAAKQNNEKKMKMLEQKEQKLEGPSVFDSVVA